jgi:hypothetical protein
MTARAVLTEILGRFNGYNNGAIGISQRDLAERLSTSNFRAISAATVELIESGFVDVAVEGKWKQRQARLYRLTFILTGNGPPYQAATNDYLHRAFSRADNASAESSRFADRASAGTLGLADNASAVIDGRPPISFADPADNASALIVKPYPGTFLEGANPLNSTPENTAGRFAPGKAAA